MLRIPNKRMPAAMIQIVGYRPIVVQWNLDSATTTKQLR